MLKFPFDGTDSETAKMDQKKIEIRQSIHQGLLPWGSTAVEEAEWGSMVDLLRNCWQMSPKLRPPASFVAQKLLDILTQYAAAPNSKISESSPAAQQTQLIAIKQKCLEMIQQKREKKESVLPRLVNEQFGVLVTSNRQEFDPVCSFLIGAMIWWKLSDFDEWDDDYSEAFDLAPESSNPGFTCIC